MAVSVGKGKGSGRHRSRKVSMEKMTSGCVWNILAWVGSEEKACRGDIGK